MTEIDEIFNAHGKICLHRDDYPTPEQMKRGFKSFKCCPSVTTFPDIPITDEMREEVNQLMRSLASSALRKPEPHERLFRKLKSVFISGPSAGIYLGIAAVFSVIVWVIRLSI